MRFWVMTLAMMATSASAAETNEVRACSVAVKALFKSEVALTAVNQRFRVVTITVPHPTESRSRKFRCEFATFDSRIPELISFGYDDLVSGTGEAIAPLNDAIWKAFAGED